MAESTKAIIITGASTGIGKACALHLDRLGFKVYAGVRKESDRDLLKEESTGALIPIIMDVTDGNSISDALSFVEKDTNGNLYGLINNAGIGRGGVLEVTPVSEMHELFDVNVIGLMAVTKIFIPLLRKSSGRIINIGSTASFLSFPGAGLYAASKFAVRAITDSLRVELKPFGVSVVLVAPGAVESEIWDKGKAYKEKLRETVTPELKELYAPLIKFGDKLNEEMKKIPAIEVAKVVTNVLKVKKPKLTYMVGKDARGAAKAARLPKVLLDWMILKHINKTAKNYNGAMK